MISSQLDPVSAITSRTERAASLACVLAAFAALVLIGSRFFPAPNGLLGHDYGLMFPHLLIGEHWFRQNGLLRPPYFTPAFCGGMPWLGNPQSIVYSVPQAFTVFLDPLHSVLATLVVSAAAGAVGMFGLLRYAFRTSVSAATLGATLFLLNGFLIYRLAVGHLTFHAFGVTPLVSWLLLAPEGTTTIGEARRNWQRALRAGLAGCLFGYVTYGGALHLMIPIILTVVCSVLMLQMRRGFHAHVWVMLLSACLWAILISAMKLAPATVLAEKFPRSYLPMYLFSDPLRFLKSLGLAFLAPERLRDTVQMGPNREILGRHELEFGLSIVPAVLLGLTLWRINLKKYLREHYWLSTALLSVLVVPLALTVGPQWWGRLLLRVPVIRNNTMLFRWWLTYIIPLIVTSALAFDWLTRTRTLKARLVVLMVSVGVIIGQSMLRRDVYYKNPRPFYDPAAALAADRVLRSGGTLPSIERVGQTGEGRQVSFFARNDAFLSGVSAWPCYDGLFGYSLELLPDLGLREGPSLSTSGDGALNLVDPVSYLNNQTGEPIAARFRVDQLERARAFVFYRPFGGAEPMWQRIATAITAWAALISASLLGWTALSALFRATRSRRPKSASDL